MGEKGPAGVIFGGVAPEGTARTGVKVASVAGQLSHRMQWIIRYPRGNISFSVVVVFVVVVVVAVVVLYVFFLCVFAFKCTHTTKRAVHHVHRVKDPVANGLLCVTRMF